MKRTLLLNTDLPGTGSEPTPIPPQPGVPPPTPPPAAAVVVSSPSDRERDLQREIEEAKAAVKNRELTICQLQDENFRLKTPPAPAQPKKGKAPGWTFFHDDEE